MLSTERADRLLMGLAYVLGLAIRVRSPARDGAVLLYGFLIPYVMAPFGTYAFVSGLVRDPSSWTVTKCRG